MPQQILDSYVDDAVARTREAKDQDVTDELEKTVGPPVNPAFEQWVNGLPKNIGVGLYRAALNTIETVDDVFEAGAEFVINPPPGLARALGGAEDGPVSSPEEDTDPTPVPPLQTMFPGVFEAAHNFADEAEESNTFSDDITQGIAQFVIPFTSYLKGLGGLKNVETLTKVGRLALAEGVTAASAFEAHEGRMADVIEMGRQMENKFGAVLNKVSPDGSLANAYINWMTDRENEGEMEGRFKNAVDSLVATGGIVSVLKVAGTTLKVARLAASEFGSINPAKLQRGSVGAPKRKVISHLVGETGEQTISIPGVGEAVAQRGDGVLQMKRIDVLESERGRGAGIDMLIRMVDQAESDGLRLVSDVTVSPSSARLYEGLARRGFNVKRNPTTVNKNTGSLLSKDPRVPVFEVLPSKEPGVAAVAIGTGVVVLDQLDK